MIIWHGKRYWVQSPRENQHPGWNTDFEPCVVFKTTAKRIGIVSPSLGVLYLNREDFEKNGKVYHSKPCEYFYKTKPLIDPEKPRRNNIVSKEKLNAFSILGLKPPSSAREISAAYKSKARITHPDAFGSHEDFLVLQDAYNILRQ